MNSTDLPPPGRNTTGKDPLPGDNKAISFGIYLYGTVPIGVLGVVGNVLAVWVFSTLKERIKSSRDLRPFFVCLGVTDAFTLIWAIPVFGLRMVGHYESKSHYVLNLFYDFFLTMSVNTTLALGILRWLSVARPQSMLHLTHRQVVTTLAALISWCLVMTLLTFLQTMVLSFGTKSYEVLQAVRFLVGFALPTFMLGGFSVALLVAFRHQGPQVARSKRRVTVMVLLITGTSLLAYPLPIIVYYLLRLNVLGCNSGSCEKIFYAIADMLVANNSSINFLIYTSFCPSFRAALLQKLQGARTSQLRQCSTDLNEFTSRADSTTKTNAPSYKVSPAYEVSQSDEM